MTTETEIKRIETLRKYDILDTPPNGTVTVKRKEENLILEIKDEGQGLTTEDMNNAFKRFSKLSSKPTGNEGSTGLGLWIAKEIAEGHGGSVDVKSEGKDKGAVFTVELPIFEDEPSPPCHP